MKNLIRKSVQRKSFGGAVTAAQIVSWGNEFLIDILPMERTNDARVVSYKEGILKIMTSSGAVNQYIQDFEEEMRHRMMEKYQDTPLKQVVYQIHKVRLQDLL